MSTGGGGKRPIAIWRALALVTELGLAVVIPIAAGVIIGQYVTQRWGGGGGLLVGFIVLGVLIGAYNFYRLVNKVMPWT